MVNRSWVRMLQQTYESLAKTQGLSSPRITDATISPWILCLGAFRDQINLHDSLAKGGQIIGDDWQASLSHSTGEPVQSNDKLDLTSKSTIPPVCTNLHFLPRLVLRPDHRVSSINHPFPSAVPLVLLMHACILFVCSMDCLSCFIARSTFP